MAVSVRDQFGEKLGEIARLWRLQLGRRLQSHGISYAQWLALRALAEKGDGTVQKDLAEAIGVEGSTLVGLLDRLAAAGMVERREAAHDRRFKSVHLSDYARERMSELSAEQLALRHELLDDIAEEDLAACLRVFERMATRAQSIG